MQRTVAETPRGAESSALSAQACGPGKRPGADALKLIFAPARARQGFRHLILGDSGTGKTVALRAIVAAAVALLGRALIIDDGDPWKAQFPGQCFVDANEFRAALSGGLLTSTSVVFRGEPWRRIKVDVRDCGELAWSLVCNDRKPLLVVVDEFVRCLDKTVWPPWREILCEGRKVQLSLVAALQEPQALYSAAKNQLSSVQVHRCGPTVTNYLEHVWYLSPECAQTIRMLDIGEFVIVQPATPWNGVVYRFPL